MIVDAYSRPVPQYSQLYSTFNFVEDEIMQYNQVIIDGMYHSMSERRKYVFPPSLSP